MLELRDMADGDKVYQRPKDDLKKGLYIDLPLWGYHVFLAL